MKKVGIVSCYFKDNYGSALQAYATKKILDNNGVENETIEVHNNVDFKRGKRKYYSTKIFSFNFIKTKWGMIKLILDKKIVKGLSENIRIRNLKYKEFREEFNLSASCKDYESLGRMAKEKYSNIVLGSDQLWLPVNVVADYYTLNWVPEEINKISYSTSLGISEIPKKYIEMYTNFLSRINHISVREESGVDIVNKLGMTAQLVCDPTMLLNKEEWKKECKEEPIIKEKYIFCYLLGNKKIHRKFVKGLKEATGYKIVSLNHADEYVKISDEIADWVPYDIGPREWLNLVGNSEYVCTDSFHATVFALIFNKKFFNFRRHNSNSKMSTNSRLDTLLNLVGVSNERILNGDENIGEVLKYNINFESVNEKLSTIREKSKKWLLNSLVDVGKKKNI